MQESQELIQEINASRKYSLAVLLFVALFFLLFPAFVYFFSFNKYTGTVITGILILILEGALVIPCYGLARRGQSAFSKPAMWVGIFIIVGGICFDVLATVWNTPDMGLEGNSFIIFMRQNGLPLWSMYLVGFYAQATLAFISVLLWVAFVRHWRMYLNVLLVLHPQSFLEYLKAAFGGNTWYAKTNHLKVSRSYRFLWLPILLRIAPFDRWEMGLEWIGVLQPSNFYRMVVEVGLGQFTGILLLFMFGLSVFYFKNREKIQKFDRKFLQASYLNILRSCLVGTGIFICSCCGLTAVFVPSAAYLLRPPDNLKVVLTQSEIAKVGQPFFIKLDVTNTGSEPLITNQICLNSPGFPGIMEALTFVSSDPPVQLQQSQVLVGAQCFLVEQTLMPGETRRLTFYFVPFRSGDFTGSIGVSSYERMLMVDINLHVDP
jgi:hypothetical protein